MPAYDHGVQNGRANFRDPVVGPLDRYYDCPDLRFELIARDERGPAIYFNLACDSPQQLAPAFPTRGASAYPEQLRRQSM